KNRTACTSLARVRACFRRCWPCQACSRKNNSPLGFNWHRPSPNPVAPKRPWKSTIREILRKYTLDPGQYEGVLPLHPASLEEINRSHCLRVGDVLATILARCAGSIKSFCH